MVSIPAVLESAEQVVLEARGALDEGISEPVHRLEVDEGQQHLETLEQSVGKLVHRDDLVDVGYARELGDRDRHQRVGRRTEPLGDHVGGQITGENRVVHVLVPAVSAGVAHEHGAGVGLESTQRTLEGEALERIGEGLPVAVGNRGAEQLPDDVLLDHDHAEARAEVSEQCREAVLDVRVDEDLDRLRGGQRDRLNRGRGARDVALLVEQVEGVVLGEVAERGGPGTERHARVVQRCGRADHVVAEMRCHRRG